MLGLIRFFLASCVIAFHLTARIPALGNFAVNCFYVISGFLITYILHETYKFNFSMFWKNRMLRLFPAYIFFLVMGFLIIKLIPSAKEFHSNWTGNFLPGDLLGNLLIFPWAFLSDNAVANPFGAFSSIYHFAIDGNRFRIVTSSWSVGVEITCYFLLWLFIARNKFTAITSILLSLLYHAYVYVVHHSFDMAYFPFLAATLPFSMGSLGYFAHRKFKAMYFSPHKAFLITFICIGIFITNWHLYTINALGQYNIILYYTNNVIALFTTLVLLKIKTNIHLEKILKWFGDLAYPIFLCQYFGGFLAWLAIGGENRGLSIFLLGYPISIALGIVCVILIDKPLIKIRAKIRADAQSKNNQENSSR